MIRASNDDHAPACSGLLLHNAVDLFYKWAGGIYHGNVVRLQQIIDMLSDSVGTDDHNSVGKGRQLFLGIQHLHTLFFQILHHKLIVDDGSVGVNRLFCLFNLLIDLLHRALYAKTETGRLRNDDLH